MDKRTSASKIETDVRPLVPSGRNGNLGLYLFGASLLIGGIFLFSALNERREELIAPRVTSTPPEPGERIAPAPALVLPPDNSLIVERRTLQGPRPPAIVRQSRPPPPPTIRERQVAPPASSSLPNADQIVSPPMPSIPSIIERPAEFPGLNQNEEAVSERVRAGRLVNPETTVPQGTMIPAVLETALDSTRAGGARALVQRDIHSFDGSRVLIPRGSRLYGSYEAGINPGEKRAVVQWTRLLRPDGVTIALDSPSTDPLGRAGVEGEVNSRFFARFGDAILRSVLDIGVGVATRRATDGVIVALPGSTQNIAGQQESSARPVLKVRQGTSVSVFVARDLDFSSVE